MNHDSIDIYLVIDTFLLLLIGVGPKIALVPFIQITGRDRHRRSRRSSAR